MATRPTRYCDIDDLVVRIHAGSFSANAWQPIIREVLREVEGDSALLLRMPSSPNGTTESRPWAVLEQFDPTSWAAYAKEWFRHDVWFYGAQRTGRIRSGCVSVDEQLVERRSFLASPFFNDFACHANIDRMVNVCLADARSRTGVAALSLYRNPGKEAFSPADVKLLNHLARHLAVAARNLFHVQSIRFSDALRCQALDAVTAAVFAIDSSGHMILTNRMGEELIRQARWVCHHNGALLPGESLRELSIFRNALHRAAANGVGSRFIVTDAATNTQALIVAAPVTPTSDTDRWPNGVATLIWVTPISTPEDTACDMALLFVLTGAEQHLLRRLILGDDLRDAATALNVSIHTARAQLKSVFRKTGRRSQGQLLALASRLSTIRKSARS